MEDLERLKECGVVAFKTYTQWGPSGTGFWMTDDVGVALAEKDRKLGVRNICIHKGIDFGPKLYEHFTCHQPSGVPPDQISRSLNQASCGAAIVALPAHM